MIKLQAEASLKYKLESRIGLQAAVLNYYVLRTTIILYYILPTLASLYSYIIISSVHMYIKYYCQLPINNQELVKRTTLSVDF